MPGADEVRSAEACGSGGDSASTVGSVEIAAEQPNNCAVNDHIEDAEDEEDEEDDDDSPPLLKYKRFTGLPARFFTKDPISVFFCYGNIMLFGTHSGILHLCTKDLKPIRTFKAHNSSILSIECDGETFISGSIDGTVVIGLVLSNDVVKYDFKRPIQAVALDRTYSKTNGFFCGGTSGQLLYCKRNWMGQRSDLTIDENHGTITMIKTFDDIVIWCNDNGITIAQVTSKQELINIPVPDDIQQFSVYWPRIHKIDRDRLLLAWVNHVWVFKISISERKHQNQLITHATASFKSNVDEKIIDIEAHWVLEDTMIAGVSDFNDNLMILNYYPREGKNMASPELKILDRDTLDELSCDELELQNFQNLNLNDYHLVSLDGKEWLLVTSYDAILVKEFNLDDQLDFYTQRGMYFEAWKLAGYWLDKYQKIEIGNKQIEEYLQNDEIDQAIEFLAQVLSPNNYQGQDTEFIEFIIEQWNNWLHLLDTKYNALMKLSNYLPSNKFHEIYQIDPKFYQNILLYLLKHDEIEDLLIYLQKWDSSLYDLSLIQAEMQDYLTVWDNLHHLDDNNEQIKRLRYAFIDVCLKVDDPGKCVEQKIKLKDGKIMEFLDMHHLIGEFLDDLPQVMKIIIGQKEENEQEESYLDKLKQNENLHTAIAILVENSHEILPINIINTMKNSRMEIVNYLYLKELSRCEKILVKSFEDDMIELFARFDKSKLYEFIKKHKNYSIEKSIDICEKYSCNQELVYLLSRVGQNQKALKIIIDDLEDPAMAISFVQKINDQPLWDFLLDYSMDKSEFIKALLLSAGELIDPEPVVRRIPNGVKIPDLKSVILKIMANGQLDETIYVIISNIISHDTIMAQNEYFAAKNKGALIKGEDLDEVQKMPDHGFVKYIFRKDGIYLDEQVIGRRFKAQGNKITHKSLVKAKMV